MKIISEVISFGDSFLSIIHSEERSLFLFDVSFREVSDDADAVFVV